MTSERDTTTTTPEPEGIAGSDWLILAAIVGIGVIGCAVLIGYLIQSGGMLGPGGGTWRPDPAPGPLDGPDGIDLTVPDDLSSMPLADIDGRMIGDA